MADDKSSPLPLFGLLLERRTDVLAAAAFLISLITAASQILQYARGADTALLAPQTVAFHFHDYGTGTEYLRIGANMAYVNSGARGYNTVVTREEVHLIAGDVRSHQRWAGLYNLDFDGRVFSPTKIGAAGPFSIDGGEAMVRQHLFAAYVVDCGADPESETKDCNPNQNFIAKARFLNMIASDDPLELVFHSKTVGNRERLRQRCRFTFSRVRMLQIVRDGWTTAECDAVP